MRSQDFGLTVKAGTDLKAAAQVLTNLSTKATNIRTEAGPSGLGRTIGKYYDWIQEAERQLDREHL